MLDYALVFLVFGLIAGASQVAGVAALATKISWILFMTGIVLLALHLITGRTVRVARPSRFSAHILQGGDVQ